MKRKAIVTGGTGFIGSWLIQELIENDYQVIAIVRNRTHLIPQIASDERCRVIEKGLENLTTADLVEAKEYDVFFHLAWEGCAPEYKNKLDIQMNNISTSLKSLEICNKIGCKLFIMLGTVAEYTHCNGIMDFKIRQSPSDAYGAAKTSAYYFLKVRAAQLEQSFIWTILSSTFGERRTDNNIITYTIRTLLKGEKPHYGALSQMWDFLYVSDVVRALRLVAENGRKGKIYGIGSGMYMPLRDYIIQIRDLIDPSLELGIGEVESYSKQTFSSCVDIYDLIKDTGFKPQVSFDTGIKRTIEYLKILG